MFDGMLASDAHTVFYAAKYQALDFYLTDLLAKYQKWLVESPAKMEIRLDNTGNTMKEMVARQVMNATYNSREQFFTFCRRLPFRIRRGVGDLTWKNVGFCH